MTFLEDTMKQEELIKWQANRILELEEIITELENTNQTLLIKLEVYDQRNEELLFKLQSYEDNGNNIINELSILENIKPPSNSDKNKYLNPFLQYKINKFKNKINDKKLKKDLKFKIKGKEYTFSSNYIDENMINNKKEKKIYSKSNYFNKYKTKITDNDIKEKEEKNKNNELNNKKFWDNYYKNKNKNKDNMNSLFRDDPVIDFDKESYYEKYQNKHFSSMYKDIILDLDKLEKEYNNFKIIENNYNKLKEDINITSFFKSQNNKISKLFTDYENNRINEYKVLLEIGNLFVNNKFSKEERKEINSINQNSRPARLLKQSQRIYILEEFVNIKNIALAGISNWLRDTSDDNFNLLLSFFNKSNENIHDSDSDIPDLEYFSDDNEITEPRSVTRLVFT
jgi:hypothetical protein